jgi:hypothetical protein
MLKRHTGYSCGSPPSRLRDHCIAGPSSLQTRKFWKWLCITCGSGGQQSIDLLARLEHEGARFDLEIAHVEPTCGLGSGALVEVVLLKGEFSAFRMVA